MGQMFRPGNDDETIHFSLFVHVFEELKRQLRTTSHSGERVLLGEHTHYRDEFPGTKIARCRQMVSIVTAIDLRQFPQCL